VKRSRIQIRKGRFRIRGSGCVQISYECSTPISWLVPVIKVLRAKWKYSADSQNRPNLDPLKWTESATVQLRQCHGYPWYPPPPHQDELDGKTIPWVGGRGGGASCEIWTVQNWKCLQIPFRMNICTQIPSGSWQGSTVPTYRCILGDTALIRDIYGFF
jgi:hypothetical protein